MGFKFNPLTCNFDLAGSSGGSGATTALDNLASVAINTGLVFGTGVAGLLSTQSINAASPTANMVVKSADNAWVFGGDGNSGTLTLASGDTGNGITGTVVLKSGATGIRGSGDVSVFSGSAGGVADKSGNLFLYTGDSGGNASGDVGIYVGSSNTATGTIFIGDNGTASVTGQGGNIDIQSMSSAAGFNGGNILLTAGDGDAKGTIKLTARVIQNLSPVEMVNMDTTTRDTLTPSPGWMIFNTTLSKLQVYTGATWETITSA